MCPACLTTAALAVAGVTSAGGLTALVVKKVRAKNGAKSNNPTPGIEGDQGGDQDGSLKSRVTR